MAMSEQQFPLKQHTSSCSQLAHSICLWWLPHNSHWCGLKWNRWWVEVTWVWLKTESNTLLSSHRTFRVHAQLCPHNNHQICGRACHSDKSCWPRCSSTLRHDMHYTGSSEQYHWRKRSAVACSWLASPLVLLWFTSKIFAWDLQCTYHISSQQTLNWCIATGVLSRNYCLGGDGGFANNIELKN